MVALFLTTTISCADALNVIQRLTKVVGLTELQKTEIVQEIRKTIPFCPVIVKNEMKK
mgnify:CR=1 FL=1